MARRHWLIAAGSALVVLVAVVVVLGITASRDDREAPEVAVTERPEDTTNERPDADAETPRAERDQDERRTGAGPGMDTRSRSRSEAARLVDDAASGSLGMPAMLEFGADWCPPCREMRPIVRKLETDYRGSLRVIYIDVDKDPELADEYKIEVVPVQIILDEDGREAYRHEGFLARKDLDNQLSKLGIESSQP